MKVCPSCNGEKFIISGIERHDWVVDGNGEFIEDGGCYDTERVGDTCWECTGCGEVYSDNKELKEV